MRLSPRGPGATILDRQHDDLDDPAAYAAGWHRHLDFLAAHLAGQDLSFGDFWTGYDALVARYRDPAPAD